MDEHIKAVLAYIWDEEQRHYEETHDVDLDVVDLDSYEIDREHILYHLNELRKLIK